MERPQRRLPTPSTTRSGKPAVCPTTAELTEELRQAEIITNLTQYTYDTVAEQAPYRVHDYCIILTQDCDLLSDYEAAQKGTIFLNGVLIFEADTIEQRRPTLGDNKAWRYVRDN